MVFIAGLDCTNTKTIRPEFWTAKTLGDIRHPRLFLTIQIPRETHFELKKGKARASGEGSLWRTLNRRLTLYDTKHDLCQLTPQTTKNMGSGNQELARAGNGASSDTDDADDWSSGDWRELVQEKDHQITELNKKITSGWGRMGPDGAGWGRMGPDGAGNSVSLHMWHLLS